MPCQNGRREGACRSDGAAGQTVATYYDYIAIGDAIRGIGRRARADQGILRRPGLYGAQRSDTIRIRGRNGWKNWSQSRIYRTTRSSPRWWLQANKWPGADGVNDHGPRHVGYCGAITPRSFKAWVRRAYGRAVGRIVGWIHDVGYIHQPDRPSGMRSDADDAGAARDGYAA